MVVLLVRELAAQIGGRVTGDPDRPIAGVSTPDAAGPTDLVCIGHADEVAALARSRAAAAIVPPGIRVPAPIVGIEADHPALAMAKAIDLLVPPVREWRTISPQAVIAASAYLGEGVGIGPFSVVGEGVRIGRNAEIHANVAVGAGCEIGEGTVLRAGVRLYPGAIVGQRVIVHAGAVIGGDSFGYVEEPGGAQAPPSEPHRYRKLRKVGRVILEDDVEIGANTTVDRAALTETRIGRGTKVGNLASIGHSCQIGRHCVIASHAAIPAATVVADYVAVGERVQTPRAPEAPARHGPERPSVPADRPPDGPGERPPARRELPRRTASLTFIERFRRYTGR